MPTSHIISYECSTFECQSTRLLGTKLLDDFAGIDGPISVSMQASETTQPHCSHGGPHIGLDPPYSIYERSGVAVGRGMVSRMGRMAVTLLGYSSLLVQQSVYRRVVGLSSASTCAHFTFHCTVSPSNAALSVKSGLCVLKILSVVSGLSRWIFLGISCCPRNLSRCFSSLLLSSFNKWSTKGR